MLKYVGSFGGRAFKGKDRHVLDRFSTWELHEECRRIARTYGPLFDSVGHDLGPLFGVYVLQHNKNVRREDEESKREEPAEAAEDEKDPETMRESVVIASPSSEPSDVTSLIDAQNIRSGSAGVQHHKVSSEKHHEVSMSEIIRRASKSKTRSRSPESEEARGEALFRELRCGPHEDWSHNQKGRLPKKRKLAD